MPKLRAFIDAAKDVSRPAANGSGWRNPPALDAVTPATGSWTRCLTSQRALGGEVLSRIRGF